MIPVLLLTSNKQSLEGCAGAKSDRTTLNNPNLKYQVSLATPPEVSLNSYMYDNTHILSVALKLVPAQI